MHAQRKNKQVFIGPLLGEGRLQSITTIHHLIYLFMKSSKIFVSFCSPNNECVTWACLQCGKRKQDLRHFFN